MTPDTHDHAQVNVLLKHMPDQLWRQVKAKAALERRTLREVVTALLKIYVEPDTNIW